MNIPALQKGRWKLLADIIYKLRLVNQRVGQPYFINQNYISGPKQQMRCISINNSPENVAKSHIIKLNYIYENNKVGTWWMMQDKGMNKI
jgi:hypothetical protein